MGTLEIVTVLACMASLAAKWFFVHRVASLEKVLEVERKGYALTRKDLSRALQRHKVLVAELKQLEAKRASNQRNIGRGKKIHDGLKAVESKEEQVKAQQRELLQLEDKASDH